MTDCILSMQFQFYTSIYINIRWWSDMWIFFAMSDVGYFLLNSRPVSVMKSWSVHPMRGLVRSLSSALCSSACASCRPRQVLGGEAPLVLGRHTVPWDSLISLLVSVLKCFKCLFACGTRKIPRIYDQTTPRPRSYHGSSTTATSKHCAPQVWGSFTYTTLESNGPQISPVYRICLYSYTFELDVPKSNFFPRHNLKIYPV